MTEHTATTWTAEACSASSAPLAFKQGVGMWQAFATAVAGVPLALPRAATTRPKPDKQPTASSRQHPQL